MDQTPGATEQKLMRALMYFRKVGWQHMHSIEGCRPSEFRALFVIQKGAKPGSPEMKVSEISKVLHVTSPTVTQMLNSLEAQGLVERHTDTMDRRVVAVRLTAKGEAITKQAADAFLSHIREMIEYLGEEESNQLAELLSKVTRYFMGKQASSAYQFPWNGEDEV